MLILSNSVDAVTAEKDEAHEKCLSISSQLEERSIRLNILNGQLQVAQSEKQEFEELVIQLKSTCEERDIKLTKLAQQIQKQKGDQQDDDAIAFGAVNSHKQKHSAPVAPNASLPVPSAAPAPTPSSPATPVVSISVDVHEERVFSLSSQLEETKIKCDRLFNSLEIAKCVLFSS